MRDACTSLYVPSDDIGVGPRWKPNCRTHACAWGQTLQLRQRTQADDLGLRFSHRTPRKLDTLSSTAGYL